MIQNLALDYEKAEFGNSAIIHGDCLEWLSRIPENSIHAILTDPPYGVREYEAHELEKLAAGRGGIWRIPPSFDGNVRAPLPRFTALEERDREKMALFFREWSRLCVQALRPGAHVFVASNAFIVPLLLSSLIEGGLEFRGQMMRLVRTLRGGDRPKNAEQEFPFVSSMPRGCYEPWVLFRKPLPNGMKVSDALREFQTGGLRRLPNGNPFEDVIPSERTPKAERAIADHPSLKPQSLMRLLAYIALPLGEGVVVDPFAGSGSTIAAAEAVGVSALGIERHRPYFDMAKAAVPRLSALPSRTDGITGRGDSPRLFDRLSTRDVAALAAE
jgi:site-specific DNA-methyltransferase (adenine-specific)